MKAIVTRSYVDKYSMQSMPKGAILEVSEERFRELTTGPLGVFVEEIKTTRILEVSKDDGDKTVINDVVVEKPDFSKMSKAQLVEYSKDIKLNMDITKAEMIELLEK